MALQASSPSRPSGLSQSPADAYQPDNSQHHHYPERAVNAYANMSSGSMPARVPVPAAPQQASSSSSRDARYDSSHAPGPVVQPPPRTSSNQQRSQSVALATDVQLADRTRSRGTSQGPPSVSGRTADTSQGSPANSNAGFSTARPADLSRGNSEVISKVVIDDPKNDIQREQARVAESVPDPASLSRVVSMPPVINSASDPNKPVMKRQDFSSTASKRKEARLGDYILGQTLGEGEFGKVKLGWKKDGSVQVAVKLMRRENLNTNPGRLPKIYREITILGQLSHPNIVKLHEMVETERYIGIILEYASGGELFDYILTHRYLKDNAARRLFAQLVSGVGYLHKKGIVHRDLKLENLLLDRNRNLMISDFGFANTFDPRDELGEEIETRITDKDFVKRRDLERVQRNGFRRGDLMQTSCGSPCYAAPELVVSDSLYTGRKVDVWSCGVILYAMLAGYLPFDDDPANPEGDNINLLYKYICNTPLTFPEYVTPHARDLLRRILVPDPRKRADLFEVARHSWLSEYAHVVEHITSTTTTVDDLAATAPLAGNKAPATQSKDRRQGDPSQPNQLVRSASVREPAKAPAQSGISQQSKAEAQTDKASSPRDPKRRTVQLEYVPPRTQTQRGEASPTDMPETIGIPSTIPAAAIKTTADGKPLPRNPPIGQAVTMASGFTQRQNLPAPTRPGKDAQRAVTDANGTFIQSPTRPTTGNSLSSNSAGRLPSRGNSYSQVLAPTVAATSASGKIQQPPPQPKNRQYTISSPVPQPEPYIADNVQRPVSSRMPSVRKSRQSGHGPEAKGHKRSTTLGNIFGRNSLFSSNKTNTQNESPRPDRRYPPVSMKTTVTGDSPRASNESRTRPSLGVSRKTSGSDVSNKPEKNRRFSLLPTGFSLKNLGSSNKEGHMERHPQRGATSAGHPADSTESMPFTSNQPMPPRTAPQQEYATDAYGRAGSHSAYATQPIPANRARPTSRMQHSSSGYMYGTSAPAEAQLSTSYPATSRIPLSSTAPQMMQSIQPHGYNGQTSGSYPAGFNDDDDAQPSGSGGGAGRMLQNNNRRFADEFQDGGHSGTSGAARRVMDFFRRRGKARAGES